MSEESVYFSLGNADGTHDVKEIKKALDTLPGVLSVSVKGGHVAVDFDTTGTQSTRIQKQLEKSGYTINDVH